MYRQVKKLDELGRKAYVPIMANYARRIRLYIQAITENPDKINTVKTLKADMGAVKDAAALFIKSLLLGMDHSAGQKEFADDDDDLDTLPFEQALDYMEKRVPIDRDAYYALSGRLKFRSFTVSRVADGDMVAKVKKQLEAALENGDGLGDFLKLTDEALFEGAGLGKGGGAYWETVYRTNMQTVYNTGRAIGFDADPPIALELVGIGDARQTHVCRSLTQPPVRKLYTDPFWKTHWPPFHFSCRTTVRAIYDEAELNEGEYRAEPAASDEPAKGFGTYPLENDEWWDELRDQKRRAVKYGVQGEIEEAKKRLIITGGNYGALKDEDFTKQDKYALTYYESIRNRKEPTDIKKIAKNTGFTEKDVEAIRDHLFKNEHRFDDGTKKRFDPDWKISQAWQRLEQGRHTKTDILLLNHEREELTIMRQHGYTYDTAHELANKKFAWDKATKG